MRCIFCKEDASKSRSVEHIIPESLGNTTQILPVGIFRDPCNNYFARKVEKPFLESKTVVALRHHQAIPSKAGRIPPLLGVLSGHEVTVRRDLKEPFAASILVPTEYFDEVVKSAQLNLTIPAPTDDLEEYSISRFLAKAALESIADRIRHQPEGLEWLTHSQFDPIRIYARRVP